ncbi:DUF3558 domain-containing protein [Nocardia neocaledoniensis]|nr:DUF3558 domain-containing protein [Nocardia neocaledoniensis]
MIAAVVGGCAGENASDGDESASVSSPVTTISAPARPTLTAANLQPPSQDNSYTRSSNRPKVVVDPCTWVDDAAIQGTGFDPQSRRRGKDMIAEYSFLACNFKKGTDATLVLESSNVSLDEVRNKYIGDTEDMIVNGRPAVKSTKGDPDGCSIDIQTAVGYFGITVRVHTSGRTQGMSPCDGILDLATELEPSIGKEN